MTRREELIADEAGSRAAIVKEALTWLLTPYHHEAGLKGIGVDCAYLALKIYANVGLIEDYDPGRYPQDWHVHRNVERYLAEVLKFGAAINVSDVKPGDLILFKYVRVYSHGAIVTAKNQVIHAHKRIGFVTLADLDSDVELIGTPKMAFSFWPSNVG